MAKLNKTEVDKLTPGEPDYFVWDETLPGFGVRVWPSGTKVYVAQYRANGRTRRHKIGTHGAITCEQARKLARAVLGDVARGDDPAEERQTRRKSLTVADLCARYLEAADKGLIRGKGGRAKKPSTMATDRGRVARHIVPLLGNKLVIDLTRADLNRFVRDVQTGKTAAVEKTRLRGRAVVTGGPGAAARTLGLLGGILTYAVAEGVIDSNPATGIKKPADGKRTRRLTPAEYRALGEALAAAALEGETPQAINGAWLLALTGCRLGEVAALRWSDIDDAGQALRLADSKTGASVRPMGRAVFDVLARIDRVPGNDHVLASPRDSNTGAPYGGMSKGMVRLTTRAGLTGVTAHTLRHSFASTAGDLGFADGTIGAMLGHAKGTVTSRYVHHLDTVLIAAADKVARAILTQMTGAKADVIALPTGAKTRKRVRD